MVVVRRSPDTVFLTVDELVEVRPAVGRRTAVVGIP
jgi:hypothetical protein